MHKENKLSTGSLKGSVITCMRVEGRMEELAEILELKGSTMLMQKPNHLLSRVVTRGRSELIAVLGKLPVCCAFTILGS